jgi:type IV secretion system protein VirB3
MAIRQDTLFLGMTRPAQFWGTHWGALVANVIVTMYTFMFTEALWAILLCVPIHAVCWLISRHDPNAFRLIGLALLTRTRSLGNALYWRASSANPFTKRSY